MDDKDFEGTIVLEQLAALGMVDAFFDAIDADDVELAIELMQKANIDRHTIAIVVKKIKSADGQH